MIAGGSQNSLLTRCDGFSRRGTYMRRPIRLALGLVLLGVWLAQRAEARIWKDVTGSYTIEADLVGFNETTVILQRENKELGAFPIDRLSEEDREYLKSKAALDAHRENLGALQTWTTTRGLNLVGRIVDYTQREVTIQRRRGRTYVNDTVYENLPEVYQRILLGVVEHFENFSVANRADLERWVMGLRGEPRTYKLEGVILELENGDEYGIPFFLLAEQDRNLLQAGYSDWLAAKGIVPESGGGLPVGSIGTSSDHQLRLQSLAAAYHQNQQINQQIAMMNLNLQAIQAGLTSMWEVTLYPAPGNPFPPRWVVTMGRNSQIATQVALQQNPGFVPGPVRRVSN